MQRKKSKTRPTKFGRSILHCEQLEPRLLLAADLEREHVRNEVLIQYAPQTSAAQRAAARSAVGGQLAETIYTQTMRASGSGLLERVRFNNSVALDRVIGALERSPKVMYAEPNYIYRPAAVSNDTYYVNGNLWGMYSDDLTTAVGPAGTTNQFGSQAEKAWADGATGSSNIIVGVIDEGIQVTHPDLVDNIWVNPFETVGDGIDNDGNGYIDDVNGWDFFYNNSSVYDVGEDSHGTHVAGTIGGKGGNSFGVVGVNWNVKMISAKFLGPGGGSTTNAIKAVDYLTDLKARHGVNIVASNNSWGGGGYSQALHDAIIRHAKRDILFVAAAGNSNVNNDAGGYYPSSYNTSVGTSSETAASYDGVISVAAIDSSGNKASFSSYGATTVDIGAPGVSIWSSVPSNTYSAYNGTSMATPHVTGAVALYASVQPFAASGASLKSAILNSATPTTSMAGITVTGGRLNVYNALKQSAFLSMDAERYTLPDTIGLSVKDPSANAGSTVVDTVSVQLSSTTESSPLTVVLVETGANTGVFSGTASLAAGSPVSGDGVLQASSGDTITANYAPLGQSVTATVDAVPPIITGINATPQSLSARIAWTTNEASTTVVRYGTSAGNLNLTYSNTSLVTSHVAGLVGLSPLTTYYYQVSSSDATGNVATSEILQFTTGNTASILFVDDDQGATYERFFKDALTANGYSYDVWDAVSVGATPSTTDLNRYGRVIWNTGYDYSAATAGLSTGEQTAISGYLNAGGRIFISGQDVLYNRVDLAFQTNYLKVASYINDEGTASPHTESGLTGNPISSGMSLSVTRPSDYPAFYVDDVTPVAGAEATFQSPWGYSSVNYRGDYANGGFGMVFLTFPFEAISTSAADPNNQKVVMQRIMDYLGTGTASPFVLTAPATYTTTEALGAATFGVRLATQPTANVTISVSSSDTTEGTASVSSLTFTPTNWNVAQNVTVSGVNDNVDDGDIAYRILLGAATSSDPNFNGADPVDIYLTNTDNDTAGITVSSPSSTTTTEAGGISTFTVRLTSEPTANVTIPISSNDTTEGIVSVASLVFTSSNWNTPQTITVTGVNDFLDDGDIAYLAVTAAATSSDPLYSNRNAADVSLTNIDNDTAGITVSPPSGTITTEAGGTVTFTIKLDSQPTASVMIPISSSDTTEGTVSTASLTFTTSNWNTPQTVTVTGVDDNVKDGNVAYSVITGTASSTDTLYNTLNPADVTLTNNDNDNAGITVSAPSGSTTTEAGGTVTFTVKLDLQPTADVRIPISSSDTSEGLVSVSELIFTSGNWDTPQTVTVTGVDDFIDDGDSAYSIVTGSAASTDALYNGMNPADISLTNADDDTAGFTISSPSSNATSEVGGSVTFTIKLNSEPSAAVTLPISSGDLTEGTVSVSSLTFTSANWNVPQTVTVTGVDDAVDDGDVSYSIITGAATSSDTGYNNQNPADVSLVNTDNDTAGITVSSPSSTTTTEAGGIVTFTVKLESEPTADVTIPISSNDTSEGSVSVSSLIFTSVNWNTPQTVTVTGMNDSIDDGDISYSIVIGAATSSDAVYNGRNPADITLSNTDDDTAGITVSSPSSTTTTEAGGIVTFTVKLNSEPTASVTIPISSSDTTEGSVSVSSLIFTSVNWNTPQTVTVTGMNDSIDDGDISYSIVVGAATTSDTVYNGLNPTDVTLTNTDDDTAGVTVSSPSSATTTEAGGTITFTVKLDSEPTASVTIPINSSDATEGSVSISSLTFNSGNWNTPQTVTVTGVNDNVDDGDISYTIITGAATSSDTNYSNHNAADVTLTNADNDTAGVTVSSPSGTTTTEAGASVTFTVRLNSEPTGSVTIPISSSDLSEGTTSHSSLTFDSSNWNVAQTVTVTGVNDSVDDGDVSYTIITGSATSSDSGYSTHNPADITLTNTDNDTAGISVASLSGTTTSEAGGFVTFTVRLNSEPVANVTIPITSGDTTEGSVDVSSLVFNSSNWNIAQTVRVAGADDVLVDGNIAYTVIIGAAGSTDSSYNLLNPADISLTNLDNDTPTKFFVVNDGAPDQTFEYDAAGGAIENYTIDSANTAPRGIVSNVAGDRLWVVDANRNIYVYNNSGGRLGSWALGSIASTATVEGIATDGTHIWIVDSKSDRVYYYANAASRLSSTTAVAANNSFALNNGNKNAKDLVFGSDGTNRYLWVVDDATTDKVFRYTVNSSTGLGTLSTSWNLNTNNRAPTGITLDPGSTSGDLWVVDNGTTKQVYRYPNGRSATATPLNNGPVFNLSSTNTNPQGIADPPPAMPTEEVFADLDQSNASYRNSIDAVLGAAFTAPSTTTSNRLINDSDESSTSSVLVLNNRIVRNRVDHSLPIASMGAKVSVKDRAMNLDTQRIDEESTFDFADYDNGLLAELSIDWK